MRYAGDRDRPAAGAIFVADVLGGIFGYAAIQTALVQRAHTGKGQRIDVALMDCMLNLLVYELQEAQFPIRAPRPTYGPVRARDGDILIAPVTARNFTALCEVTGQSELADDPRFNALPARGANWTAMMQVVEKWTEQRTADECLAALDAAGVPCARYRDPGAALADPHLLARGSFATIADRAGEFAGVNAPWKMSGAETSIGREIPAVGAHRDEVLSRALGLSAAAIAGLADSGIFGKAKQRPNERQREKAEGQPG
jgi:crotonobetainyl-CoA:carnitine CoA-transferase CaiB-like acyl-CoA transferase